MDSISHYMIEGNKNFMEGLFSHAISYYIEAVNLSPENVDVLENIAECYTKLGYHYRALDESDYILENETSYCFQVVYTRANALLGLQRFKEAIQYITRHMSINDELKRSRDLINLLKKLHSLEYQQRTGIYDMLKLYLNENLNEDFADYVGPVKIETIPGKGRGLVATEDISAGQLLIVNKAFAIAYQDDITDTKWLGFEELVESVTIKLTVEPEHAQWFYQSYAGPEMSFLEHSLAGNNSVDYRRIQGVCSHTSTIASRNPLISTSRKRRGLWILPAYINHNGFDSNSFWAIYGDIMVVRTFKNISKGAEILVSYVDVDSPYEYRDYECKQHGFQCSCSLCQADRNDSEEVRRRRISIHEQISQATPYPRLLLTFVDQLDKLRPDKPELNVYKISPLQHIAFNYFSRKQFKKAAETLMKAHRIMRNNPLITTAVKYSMIILNSYIALKNEPEIYKWIDIVKQDLISAYGSVEIFKFIGHYTLVSLKELNISFV